MYISTVQRKAFLYNDCLDITIVYRRFNGIDFSEIRVYVP